MLHRNTIALRSLVLAAIGIGLGSFVLGIWLSKPKPINIMVDGLLAGEAFTIDHLIKVRQLVIVGSVEKQEQVQLSTLPWDLSAPLPYSDWHVKVVEVIYQNMEKPVAAGNTIVVRTFGGTVGEVSLDFPDNPDFRVGEKAVLFLYSGDKDAFTASEGEPHFVAFNSGTFKVDNNGMAYRRGSPPNTPSSLPVAELKSLIIESATAVQKHN